MKVSIITVTFNSEKFLEACILSVLNQKYADIEYILVDGGSTDSTLEVAKSHESRIAKIVSEPDEGIYDAINKGIALATGEIVGILNSDDFFADCHVIDRVVGAFQQCHGVDVVFADVDFVNIKNGGVSRHYSSKYFRPWMFRFGFQPAHPTFYTLRSNFFKYGMYRTDLKIAGDFELLLRFLYKNGLPFCYINDTWVKMREGGISTKNLSSKIQLNREILLACKVNGVFSSMLLTYMKYLIKWWGFVFNKRK